MSEHTHEYVIVHHPSGDVAEADTLDAAHLAAKTLIDDNGHVGSCFIKTFGYTIVGYVSAAADEKFRTATLGGKC